MALTVLAALIAIAPFQAAQNADSQVIESCLLEFFAESKWRSMDWREGDFIVLDPEYRKGYRSPVEQIRELAGREKRNRKSGNPEHIAFLERAATEIGRDGATSATATPIKQLSLDPRIVVAKVDRAIRGYSPPKLKNRDGVMGAIRVAVRCERPVYSRAGDQAYLRVSAPWSIHSADVNFFLQKQGGTWTVRLVVPLFYV